MTRSPRLAEELRDYFGQFGEIESVNVKTDPNTGRSRGFAFLVFSNTDAIEKVRLQREISVWDIIAQSHSQTNVTAADVLLRLFGVKASHLHITLTLQGYLCYNSSNDDSFQSVLLLICVEDARLLIS